MNPSCSVCDYQHGRPIWTNSIWPPILGFHSRTQQSFWKMSIHLFFWETAFDITFKAYRPAFNQQQPEILPVKSFSNFLCVCAFFSRFLAPETWQLWLSVSGVCCKWNEASCNWWDQLSFQSDWQLIWICQEFRLCHVTLSSITWRLLYTF